MIQGVGAASMLVPLYIAEVSPPKIRGRLVGIYEIGVQAGTCIGFWINYGLKINMKESTSQWMTPFAVQLIPGGILIIGMLFLPDSPRYVHGPGSLLIPLSNYCSDGTHDARAGKKLSLFCRCSETFLLTMPTSKRRSIAS
jgi:MFS family permease